MLNFQHHYSSLQSHMIFQKSFYADLLLKCVFHLQDSYFDVMFMSSFLLSYSLFSSCLPGFLCFLVCSVVTHYVHLSLVKGIVHAKMKIWCWSANPQGIPHALKRSKQWVTYTHDKWLPRTHLHARACWRITVRLLWTCSGQLDIAVDQK